MVTNTTRGNRHRHLCNLPDVWYCPLLASCRWRDFFGVDWLTLMIYLVVFHRPLWKIIKLGSSSPKFRGEHLKKIWKSCQKPSLDLSTHLRQACEQAHILELWFRQDHLLRFAKSCHQQDFAHTVDGSEICRKTSGYGKYLIIYRVLYIPGGAGFLTSTVSSQCKLLFCILHVTRGSLLVNGLESVFLSASPNMLVHLVRFQQQACGPEQSM